MTMRRALIWSALMHVAAIAVIWFGVPAPGFETTEPVVIVAVDIADFSETPERRAPQPRPKPPEPVEETPPEPPPAPKEPDLAMIPPPPVPEPVPETPEPVPAPAPAEAEEKPKTLLPARPRPKPTPPKPKDDFASVLKTVELLERDKPAKPPPPKPQESDDFLDDLAILLDDTEPPREERTQLAPVLGNRLTASEEDALARHIEPCWNVPIGARNPEELAVVVRLYINRDGTVRSAEVVDSARMNRDRFYRAAAEAALRAVVNERCQPLPIPPGKYEQLKVFEYNFDPSKMVGR